MIRSILFAGAACLTVSACSDGGATMSEVPDTEAEKTAMATEIANMMSDPAMMDQMFSAETMAASIPDMSAMCATAPAGEIAACNQRMEASKTAIQQLQVEMMDKARAMTPQLMQDMGAIMARTYTGEELAAMHSFYSSPEGKSILQKQPQVMAEFMPAVMQRMQPLQLEMVQELSERMNASAVTTPNLVVPGATPSTTVPGATVTPPPSTPPATTTTPSPTTTLSPTTTPSPTLPRPN